MIDEAKDTAIVADAARQPFGPRGFGSFATSGCDFAGIVSRLSALHFWSRRL